MQDRSEELEKAAEVIAGSVKPTEVKGLLSTAVKKRNRCGDAGRALVLPTRSSTKAITGKTANGSLGCAREPT